MLSKSRTSNISLTSRDESFNNYQYKISKNSNLFHKGKVKLRIKINNILLIKGKIETKNEYHYQLKISSQKNVSQIYNYNDFTQKEMEFNFFRIPNKVSLKILQIKGIYSSLLGEFAI